MSPTPVISEVFHELLPIDIRADWHTWTVDTDPGVDDVLAMSVVLV